MTDIPEDDIPEIEDINELIGQFTDQIMEDVTGASGASFQVIGTHEKGWWDSNLASYMEAYAFENVADLQDLDRLLGMELVSYRHANWLIRGTDYDGLLLTDEKQIREAKDKIDKEIRLLKAHMGLARKARIESEQQSVADYLKKLLFRAREFGVHRDRQISAAIDLFMELRSMIGLHDRTDEEERAHLGVSQSQIFDWLREEALPRFDEIDNAFRVNQKLWIEEVK